MNEVIDEVSVVSSDVEEDIETCAAEIQKDIEGGMREETESNWFHARFIDLLVVKSQSVSVTKGITVFSSKKNCKETSQKDSKMESGILLSKQKKMKK